MFSANGSAPVEFQSTASYILHRIVYGTRTLPTIYIRHMANFAVHFRIVFHLPQPQQQNVTKLNYGTKQPSGKLIRRPFVVDVVLNTYTNKFWNWHFIIALWAWQVSPPTRSCCSNRISWCALDYNRNRTLIR